MSNELDKHVGDQLHGYESDVDAEAIWAAVRPARPRRRWLWLLLLFGVIGMAGAAWWASSSTAPSADMLPEQIEVEQSEVDDLQLSTSSKNTEGEAQSLSDVETNQVTQQSANVPSAQQQVLAANNDLQEAPRGIGTDAPANASRNTEILTLSEEAEEKNGGTLAIELPTEQTTTADIRQDQPTELVSASETAQSSSSENEIGTEEASTEIAKTAVDFSSVDYLLPTLAGSLGRQMPFEAEVALEDSYRRRSRLSPWSAQVDAAYLIPNRSIRSQDSLGAFVANRLTTESVLEAWSTDLTANYNWHKNWQLRVGLGYTQINTEFSFNNTEVRIDSVFGVQSIVFNPDGTADTIGGFIEQRETIVRERQIYNSFRQWEVPILINYEASLGQLSVIAEAGVRLRLTRTWEGQVLATNAEDVVPWAEQDWYRDQLGFSLQAGLLAGYELSPQWQLRAGATLRYTPQDFTKADVAFQERYQLGGLQLGLRYQFR